MLGVVWRVALATSLILPLAGAHKVGAIYFGQWHETEINNALHGPGWTEWSLVQHATPRYDKHHQPNVPLQVPGFGPSHPENDPTNFAAKIDAASKNGVDFFMFDWYWYAHPMLAKGHGPFLEGALEQGFLNAPNSEQMEFALMWANQDWVDLHPAKRSWNECYRSGGPSQNPELQPTRDGRASSLMIFDGYLQGNASIARAGLDYVVDTYFSRRNYLRVPTLAMHGDRATVKQCCYFAFYQLEYLAWGFGEEASRDLLARFRQRTKEQGAANPDACQCLHISSMQDKPGGSQLSGLVDGFSDYGWMKTTEASAWPETPYEEIVEAGVAAWTTRTQEVLPALYVPPISVAWDSSPRTAATDPFVNGDYPWGPAWHSTPQQWRLALEQAKAFLDARCSSSFDVVEGVTGAEYCPPLLINAWNEWSEGAYLEPDVQFGFAKMEAIGQVFSQSEAASIAVGAIRWDAWFGAPADRNFGVVGRTVTLDMSPAEFHERLPFFARELDRPDAMNATVVLDGNSTEVMAQEIRYAANFGIDFWAFCAYPLGCRDYHPADSECEDIQCCADNYALGYALQRYLEQPDELANLVKFSLVLQPGYWYPAAAHGGNETVEEEIHRFVSYFQRENYQKVLDGRPVVYIFGGNDDVSEPLGRLCEAAIAAGLQRPYLVAMADSAQAAWQRAQTLGADAISAYVVQRNPHQDEAVPFASGIAQPEAQFWEDAKALGAPLVPSISAGWDPRPRQFIDLPWGEQGQKSCVEALGHTCYIEDPTMQELQDHTRDAVSFSLQNPAVVEARAALVSAWNENDEGHWIVPSLHRGTEKLEAVQRGIAAGHGAMRGVVV